MGKEPAAWLLGTVTQGIKDLSLLESWSLRSVSFEQPFNKLPSLALEDLFFLLSDFFCYCNNDNNDNNNDDHDNNNLVHVFLILKDFQDFKDFFGMHFVLFPPTSANICQSLTTFLRRKSCV